MKTFLTLSLHLLITSFLFSQSPLGIPYQAVIRDNVGAPLVNASVTVRFTLHQNTIDGPVEYQEAQSLSTNAFGVINTQFGMGMATQGGFENIDWSNTTKFIQVEANNGSGFLDMGTQQMMSVPFAMYSSKSANATYADNGFSNVSQTGDTLYMSNGTFIIVPGISAANFPGPVLGCTNAQACNYNAAATQDNGSCLMQSASCDDGNANTTNDVINANCQCAGTATGNGVFVPGNGLTDIDGTVYTSVVINGQEWMQQNLAVTKYRNGDPIPTGLDDATWSNITSGAYSVYNNDATNNATYGNLYNWYAVNDNRGLCPTGWHVPSDAEWTTLINYLDPNSAGGDTWSNIAGGKLKATTGWNSPNTGATNESGFSGLPSGYRDFNGAYYDIVSSVGWWSSAENGSNNAWDRGLYYSNSNVTRGSNNKHYGFSVRCVKNTAVPELHGCTDTSACNFLVNANHDDGSCLYQNATCDDGNANTTYDVINASCQCAGTANDTLDIVIGQDYQGGKVAYIFQSGDVGYVFGETHGLIAATQDLPGTYTCGCFGTTISPSQAISISFVQAIGSGSQNTLYLVNAGCGDAAQACSDLVLNGYDDWFLPSKYELAQLYINRTSIGGFQNSDYWSSSELDAFYAWLFGFSDGYPNVNSKYLSYHVRAVRAF